MLESIYLFMAGVGIVFFILSIFRKDMIIFGWLAAAFFIFLGILSFDIEKVFCAAGNVTANEWSCHTVYYKSSGLGYLWVGLGLMMFVYAIMYSIKEITPPTP